MNLDTTVELADLFAGEPQAKAGAALDRYRLRRATDSRDPVFQAAFGLLDAYFGPLGEIERRSVLEGWADQPRRVVGPHIIQYSIILAEDDSGEIAGARDCYAVTDPAARTCVVYLAHALVVPEHRRTGLASLLRAAPATLGRRALADAGVPDGDLLLAVEQEPIHPDQPDTHVRLAAYGRGGFQAIDPVALPYQQPDFRDLDALGEAARPLPLVAVIRRVGHEGDATLPRALATAWLEHLMAVFGTHCRAADLAPIRAHALAALDAWGDRPVPLVSLPQAPADAPTLRPLLAATVRPLFGR